VVLSRKNAPFAYSTPESLFGKRVGTVLGFVYPALEPYFAKKQITRVDVASEKSLLAMLNLHRVDVVLINELSALWHINSENWGYTFAYSKNEVQSYPYRMMFGKKWQPFVLVFNRELAAMKKDGSLDRLIQKYQPEKTVQQQ
jgi:polar amino acid transport system substrate-binding protein